MKKLLIRLLEKLIGIKVTGPHERVLREIQSQNLEITVIRASAETRYSMTVPIESAKEMAAKIGLLCLESGAIEISAHSNAVEMKLRIIRPKEPVDYIEMLNKL